MRQRVNASARGNLRIGPETPRLEWTNIRFKFRARLPIMEAVMGARMRRVCLTAAISAVAVVLLPVASANALVLKTTKDCPPRAISQPFAHWGDNADYVLAPDGAVENGAGEWRLRNGAQIVDGNSPFFANSPSDSHSLSIPRGGSATTGTMCIGKEHPTIRFFAKNQGSSLAYLDVQVQVETILGLEVSLPIGIERGNQSWEPSSTMRLVVNYLNLLPGTYTPVEFKFTARNGEWLVDDVYVDPRRN
jgi:hypothetical protein